MELDTLLLVSKLEISSIIAKYIEPFFSLIFVREMRVLGPSAKQQK